MKQFKVGDAVVWASKVGPVEAEYRGKQMGMSGWEACIFVREGGWYQTLVPVSELSPKPAPVGVAQED